MPNLFANQSGSAPPLRPAALTDSTGSAQSQASTTITMSELSTEPSAADYNGLQRTASSSTVRSSESGGVILSDLTITSAFDWKNQQFSREERDVRSYSHEVQLYLRRLAQTISQTRQQDAGATSAIQRTSSSHTSPTARDSDDALQQARAHVNSVTPTTLSSFSTSKDFSTSAFSSDAPRQSVLIKRLKSKAYLTSRVGNGLQSLMQLVNHDLSTGLHVYPSHNDARYAHEIVYPDNGGLMLTQFIEEGNCRVLTTHRTLDPQINAQRTTTAPAAHQLPAAYQAIDNDSLGSSAADHQPSDALLRDSTAQTPHSGDRGASTPLSPIGEGTSALSPPSHPAPSYFPAATSSEPVLPSAAAQQASLEPNRHHSYSTLQQQTPPPTTLPFDVALRRLENLLNLSISLTTVIGRMHDLNVTSNSLSPYTIMYNNAMPLSASVNPTASDLHRLLTLDMSRASVIEREYHSVNDIASTFPIQQLPFVSPEATGRMSRPSDRRSDLYSVGTILFYAAAGHPPFFVDKDHTAAQEESDQASIIVHCHLAKSAPKLYPKPLSFGVGAADEANTTQHHHRDLSNGEDVKQHRSTASQQQLDASSTDVIEFGHILRLYSLMLAKLLSKAPEDRYQSSAGLKADLLYLKSALTLVQTRRSQPNEQQTSEVTSAASTPLSSYTIGSVDMNGSFRVSQKLYGRSAAINQLLTSFDRVAGTEDDPAHGLPELVMVTGYSGVGT